MLNIARENNLSETAFVVKEENLYHLRWFTPAGEIDFCGHATLGTSFVLFNYYSLNENRIEFKTKVGNMIVYRKGEFIEMNFPRYDLHPVEVTDLMEEALGVRPIEAYKDRDLLMILEDEDLVRYLQPNHDKIRLLDGVCVAVSAKGKEYDCVSRVFAPQLDIIEDSVTGSTHCMIGPYWANRLHVNELTAFQASKRTGILKIKVESTRVNISGQATLFSLQTLL